MILQAICFDGANRRVHACEIASNASTLKEFESWRATLRESLTQDGVA